MRDILMLGICRLSYLPVPTRSMLRSFVSSNKCDVFKCHAVENSLRVNPPYACAYSHAAKNGKNALLAVSTEQGAVHVLNTAKRREWDVGACIPVFAILCARSQREVHSGQNLNGAHSIRTITPSSTYSGHAQTICLLQRPLTSLLPFRSSRHTVGRSRESCSTTRARSNASHGIRRGMRISCARAAAMG